MCKLNMQSRLIIFFAITVFAGSMEVLLESIFYTDIPRFVTNSEFLNGSAISIVIILLGGGFIFFHPIKFLIMRNDKLEPRKF